MNYINNVIYDIDHISNPRVFFFCVNIRLNYVSPGRCTRMCWVCVYTYIRHLSNKWYYYNTPTTQTIIRKLREKHPTKPGELREYNSYITYVRGKCSTRSHLCVYDDSNAFIFWGKVHDINILYLVRCKL